jgi:TatD DNase family protein
MAAASFQSGAGTLAVDIGFNACSKQFKRDLSAVMARACAAGVSSVLITGVDMKTSFHAMTLCESHKGIFKAVEMAFTAGVHPHDAKTFASSVRARRWIGMS